MDNQKLLIGLAVVVVLFVAYCMWCKKDESSEKKKVKDKKRENFTYDQLEKDDEIYELNVGCVAVLDKAGKPKGFLNLHPYTRSVSEWRDLQGQTISVDLKNYQDLFACFLDEPAEIDPQMLEKFGAVSFSVKYQGEPGKCLVHLNILVADPAIGQLKQPGNQLGGDHLLELLIHLASHIKIGQPISIIHPELDHSR